MTDEVIELVRKGFETEKADDISKAVLYYEQAASNGHTGAMLALGGHYLRMRDYLKSAEWELKAFMLGDIEAIDSLIILHAYSKGQDEVIKVFTQTFEKIYRSVSEIIEKKKDVSYESVVDMFNLGTIYDLE